MLRFDSNGAYSWAWGSLTIGVGWSSISFPFIGSSFNFRSNGILTPYHIHPLNHVVFGWA